MPNKAKFNRRNNRTADFVVIGEYKIE